MSQGRHKDVEFHVSAGEKTKVLKTFGEAASLALAMSASRGGEEAVIDVIIYSVSGARWWNGDHGVETYREDPDASVSQRISVRAQDRGRIA